MTASRSAARDDRSCTGEVETRSYTEPLGAPALRPNTRARGLDELAPRRQITALQQITDTVQGQIAT